MSVTLEQQLAHRRIDPVELEERVQELQRQVRAYRLSEVPWERLNSPLVGDG